MRKFLAGVGVVLSLALVFLPEPVLADADDVRTFILSNENGSAGGIGLIDALIAQGHGSQNLYQILQLLAAQPGSGIPSGFVTSVGNNPPGSEVFTAPLNNFAGANNPVGINADGTLLIAGLYGRDYDGDAGFVTNHAISGIGSVWYTLASNASYFIDTGVSSDSGPNHLAIGIAWVKSRDARTFMLSNEAPGYLIDKLIAAGYENLYQALQFLAAQPGSGIPADFVTEVGNHPGSDAFTAALSNFADWSNNPIAIGDDGSLIVAAVYGRDYDGQSGYVTNTVQYPGIGPAKLTMATSPVYYIDAGTNVANGVTTYYRAFGIAWADADSVSIPTLNEWGMILLSLVLAGAGLIYMKRRRQDTL